MLFVVPTALDLNYYSKETISGKSHKAYGYEPLDGYQCRWSIMFLMDPRFLTPSHYLNSGRKPGPGFATCPQFLAQYLNFATFPKQPTQTKNTKKQPKSTHLPKPPSKKCRVRDICLQKITTQIGKISSKHPPQPSHLCRPPKAGSSTNVPSAPGGWSARDASSESLGRFCWGSKPGRFQVVI